MSYLLDALIVESFIIVILLFELKSRKAFYDSLSREIADRIVKETNLNVLKERVFEMVRFVDGVIGELDRTHRRLVLEEESLIRSIRRLVEESLGTTSLGKEIRMVERSLKEATINLNNAVKALNEKIELLGLATTRIDGYYGSILSQLKDVRKYMLDIRREARKCFRDTQG